MDTVIFDRSLIIDFNDIWDKCVLLLQLNKSSCERNFWIYTVFWFTFEVNCEHCGCYFRVKLIRENNYKIWILPTEIYEKLDSRLASHTEPEQPPVSQNSERAKETHYQLAPENSQNWRLWPQQAKSEAATTAAEVVLVQDQNEQQQQQLDSQDGGRPLEQKFDMAQDVVQPSQSYPQDQHEQKPPAPRGRGRPPKCLHNPQQQEKQTKGRGQGRHHKRKPDDATMQNQVPEPKRRGRGRPRKLDKWK